MKRNFIRIISVAAITLSIVILMTSCGKSNSEIENEATTAFETIINAFKSGDSQQIKSLCITPDSLGEDTEIKSAILSSLKNITYEIKNVTVTDSKNASINVDITVIDSSKIMEQYIQNIIALVSSSEYQSKLSSMEREEYQDIMNNEFKKVLNSGEIPTITKNIDVDMRFDDGKWKLHGAALTDLLVTNTVNAVSQIKQ